VTFAGFPPRAKATALPNVFLTDVAPLLADDPVAIPVVVYAFAALQRKKGFGRCIATADVCAEPGCAEFLRRAGAGTDAVEAALRRAVDAGVFLSMFVEEEGGRHELFFLNSPADRRGWRAALAGAIDVGRVVDAPQPVAKPAPLFALYEQHIGSVTPLVAEELADAERLYPAEWLEAAFREAAAQNARSWRYVSRILERWASEGPDYAKARRDPAGRDDRYFAGKYGRILKQRLR
jgi:DnaD/phage-associated family protein